jgi:hypothetical protein
MDSTCQLIHRQTDHCVRAVAMCALMSMSAAAFADGAHVAQKAQPGDIVLLRNVAARPADRNPTAPGMALMVNASPNPQLGNSLNGSGNTGEMTDTEIDDLTAGVSNGRGNTGQSNMQHSLNAALGVNSGGNSAGAASTGNGVSNLVSGPAGAAGSVADSTRGIGAQVSNAVSQIPMIGGH